MNRHALVSEYFAAHNAHDIPTVLNLLTDDFRFELVDLWARIGKGPAQLLEEWDEVIDSKLVAIDMTMDGEAVVCNLVETNAWFQTAGIHEVHFDFANLEIQEDKIKSLIAKISPSSSEAIAKVMGRLLPWARANYPGTLHVLMPDGAFDYNRPNAKRWLSLIAAWRGDIEG